MKDSDVKHCQRCGAELEVVIGKLHHYDSATGVPVYSAQFKCPRKDHRALFGSDGHDAWDGTVKDDQFIFSDKYRIWY